MCNELDYVWNLSYPHKIAMDCDKEIPCVLIVSCAEKQPSEIVKCRLTIDINLGYFRLWNYNFDKFVLLVLFSK